MHAVFPTLFSGQLSQVVVAISEMLRDQGRHWAVPRLNRARAVHEHRDVRLVELRQNKATHVLQQQCLLNSIHRYKVLGSPRGGWGTGLSSRHHSYRLTPHVMIPL